MRLTSRKQSRESKLELSMTSMIDVVFLLLIFFMTTTAYMRPEMTLDSAIRLRERSASANSDLEPAIVEVARSGDGVVFRVGAREITSQAELTQVLRQFPNKLDGAYVRVHDDVSFQWAAAAIQACKSADFVLVSYIPWKP
jgi:biopolymer transport protein ExbD